MKGTLAQAAGAAGVLFANTIERTALLTSRVRAAGYSKGDALMTIPVLSVSYSTGGV